MNKQQRKQIAALQAEMAQYADIDHVLEHVVATGADAKAKIKEAVSNIMSDVESIRDEETEKLDNMPESLALSSKGDELQEIIEHLDEALARLGDVDSVDDDASDEDWAEAVTEFVTEADDALGNI